jgi:hypothetical protein
LEAVVRDQQYQQRPVVMARVQFLELYLLQAVEAVVLKQVLRLEALVNLVVVVVVQVILVLLRPLLDKALLDKVTLVDYHPKLLRRGRHRVAVGVQVLLVYLHLLMLMEATVARGFQTQLAEL